MVWDIVDRENQIHIVYREHEVMTVNKEDVERLHNALEQHILISKALEGK